MKDYNFEEADAPDAFVAVIIRVYN